MKSFRSIGVLVAFALSSCLMPAVAAERIPARAASVQAATDHVSLNTPAMPATVASASGSLDALMVAERLQGLSTRAGLNYTNHSTVASMLVEKDVEGRRRAIRSYPA